MAFIRPLFVDAGFWKEAGDSDYVGLAALAAGLIPILRANLPAASSNPNNVYRLTDVNNIFVFSDGLIWRPLGSQTLSSQNVSVSTSGTSETSLWSFTIPGGLLHANSVLELSYALDGPTNSNQKNHRLRLGGIAGTAATLFSTTNAFGYSEGRRRIVFKNSVASQECNSVSGSFTITSSARITTSLDFANNQELLITGQIASGTATLYNAQLQWIA